MDTHSAKHERRTKPPDQVDFQWLPKMVEDLALHFFSKKNKKQKCDHLFFCKRVVFLSEFCTASNRTPTAQQIRQNSDTLTKHGSEKSIAFLIFAQKMCDFRFGGKKGAGGQVFNFWTFCAKSAPASCSALWVSMLCDALWGAQPQPGLFCKRVGFLSELQKTTLCIFGFRHLPSRGPEAVVQTVRQRSWGTAVQSPLSRQKALVLKAFRGGEGDRGGIRSYAKKMFCQKKASGVTDRE
jgi:hypothetical protein